MCPNSAPRPCRAHAQTQRYNRVCESLSWVSSLKEVRETCQTELTFSDSLSALPSYIVSDTLFAGDGVVSTTSLSHDARTKCVQSPGLPRQSPPTVVVWKVKEKLYHDHSFTQRPGAVRP